jgi:hypothetical protein
MTIYNFLGEVFVPVNALWMNDALWRMNDGLEVVVSFQLALM